MEDRFAAPELRPDHGALAENFVFTEIRESLGPVLDEIRYWRSKFGADVDLVIARQGRIDAVEVKAGDSRGLLDRSAMSFIDADAPRRFFVVNSREQPATKVGKASASSSPTRLRRPLRKIDNHRRFCTICATVRSAFAQSTISCEPGGPIARDLGGISCPPAVAWRLL